MTLNELRYLVAVAREQHFGRAAKSCFVSQPTLSVAVKKLEEELGIQVFERDAGQIMVTAEGEPIVEQARRVLDEAARLKQLAQQKTDPLEGSLRVGAIYTVGPYLFPQLVPELRKIAPRMPLMIEENFTANLRERLRNGQVDVIIIALPFSGPGIETQPIYDEPFSVVVPKDHAWAKRKRLKSSELADQPLLLLGEGHCFRDQVIDACPECVGPGNGSEGANTVEGSSLETIRQMVASGLGITVLPATSLSYPMGARSRRSLVEIPFEGRSPTRTIALAWRKGFPRQAAVEALRDAILKSDLPDVTYLHL
ncbi:MAG: hydrogen peroxide-inducible genes activator [Gammaproteobacteria bacterium]|nr:hydrogen peroxide-inducible genes activator [Gammaproteobacteria bacterium]